MKRSFAILVLVLMPQISVGQTTLVVSARVLGDVNPCTCDVNPVGGLAQRTAQVPQLGVPGQTVMWVDAGNGLFDTPGPVPAEMMPNRRLTSITLIDAYNVGGMAAHNIGANELAEGVDYLHRLEMRATFPFLSANLWWSEEQDQQGLHFSPDLVLRSAGEGDEDAIGIIGVVTGGLRGFGWVTTDPVKAVKERIKGLQERGISNIVVLAAMNVEDAQTMAKKIKGASTIVVSGSGTIDYGGVVVRKTTLIRPMYRGRSVAVLRRGPLGIDVSEKDILREGDRNPKVEHLIKQLEQRMALPFEPPKGDTPASDDGTAPFIPAPNLEMQLKDLPIEVSADPDDEPQPTPSPQE